MIKDLKVNYNYSFSYIKEIFFGFNNSKSITY